MVVQNTEKRIPDGFAASELGQAFESPDGKYVLISYLSSPIVIDTKIEYVVFALDGAPAESYHWKILPPFEASTETDNGFYTYKAEHRGVLRVEVDVKVGGDTRTTLTLTQTIVNKNSILEGLITGVLPPGGALAALGGDPVTSTELINDFKDHINIAAASTGLNGIHPLFLAAIAYKESLFRPKEFHWQKFYLVGELIRTNEIEAIGEILNSDDYQNTRLTKQSLGVCQIKSSTGAMIIDSALWTELPIEYDQRPRVKEEIKNNYLALSPEQKIDIFNILRFPKSNLWLCAQLLSKLKNRDRRRWPDLTAEEFLGHELARKIIATEYNLGATLTPKADVKPTLYGSRVYLLTGSPFLVPFFTMMPITMPDMAPFRQAPFFEEDNRAIDDIDAIVLHTAEGTYNGTIRWFENPENPDGTFTSVSSHYIVSPSGDITQMVEIKDVAYTQTYYNDRGIGIECAGFAAQPDTWTNDLMNSLTHLVAWLCQEYGILPVHPIGEAISYDRRLEFNEVGLLGHSQIQPWNKTDPGAHFDWNSFVSDVQKRIYGVE